MGIMGITVLLGLLSIPQITRFGAYRQLNQQVIAQFFEGIDTIENQTRNNTHELISADRSIASGRSGFEYLNELFVKRHRKLLWKTTWIISAVCSALFIAGAAVLQFFPGFRLAAQELILNMLPFWAFILYFMNRGTGITRALFINCDHSLLTYSFYKQPEAVLKLFRIRLREITKINAVPATIIGLGLDVLLLISGGGTWYECLLIPATMISLSLFFSLHYLPLYYLLQPFNAGTEVKSGTYQAMTGVTYFVCYMLMRTELPAVLFGLLCITFCAAYSVIACVLVYKIAPKTFRIRQ